MALSWSDEEMPFAVICTSNSHLKYALLDLMEEIVSYLHKNNNFPKLKISHKTK